MSLYISRENLYKPQKPISACASDSDQCLHCCSLDSLNICILQALAGVAQLAGLCIYYLVRNSKNRFSLDGALIVRSVK